MVMKRNAMRRNLRQSIRKSLGRYIAIAAIISLGAGIFVGLLMTKADMVATGQSFMDEQNMFDIRLVSNYGWAKDQVAAAAALDGIETAEGVYYGDFITRFGTEREDSVYRFYTLPEKINQVALEGGRMPQKPDECLQCVRCFVPSPFKDAPVKFDICALFLHPITTVLLTIVPLPHSKGSDGSASQCFPSRRTTR